LAITGGGEAARSAADGAVRIHDVVGFGTRAYDAVVPVCFHFSTNRWGESRYRKPSCGCLYLLSRAPDPFPENLFQGTYVCTLPDIFILSSISNAGMVLLSVHCGIQKKSAGVTRDAGGVKF
jgi:hypothetical protein